MIGLAALLTALTVVQVLLPSLRTGLPWVAALHVVNAVALAVQAVAIARAPMVFREPLRGGGQGSGPAGKDQRIGRG